MMQLNYVLKKSPWRKGKLQVFGKIKQTEMKEKISREPLTNEQESHQKNKYLGSPPL